MFDDSHYVPLLRAKLAELGALGALRPEVRRNITPIIEVLPRNLSQCTTTADVERVLENLAADLAGSKGRRLFLDLSPLDWDCHRLRDLSHPLERLSELLTRSGVHPVPVITLKMNRSLSYGNRIKAVLKRFKTDLCLRITPGELSLSNGCENLVSECLNEFGVSPAHIDLVLDRCAVHSSSRAFSDLGPLIPYLDSWKTFTVLAGSFPENLENLTRGDVHHLRRFEWLHCLGSVRRVDACEPPSGAENAGGCRRGCSGGRSVDRRRSFGLQTLRPHGRTGPPMGACFGGSGPSPDRCVRRPPSRGRRHAFTSLGATVQRAVDAGRSR